MVEQLRRRAETIKALIREKPERGSELLLDFARLYAVNDDIETEVLLRQYELNANNGERNEKIKIELENYADEIVANFDAEKVAARFQNEKELTETFKQKELRNDVILVADNLEKNYRSSNFNLKVPHLELRLAEITGLVGENATGKTTLFKILAGELAQQKGSLHYQLFDLKNKLDWTDIKMRIAYVPQELPEWRGSLRENLMFDAAIHGILGKQNTREVEYIIQRLGLALHINKTWQELSGGYKLRFALAKALVWQPQLLILDEPLAFLDAKTQMIVLSDLRDLAKSLRHPISIIVSSQHLHEIESVADNMLFMRDGELENIGLTADFNQNRAYNLFELSCTLSYTEFTKTLAGLDYLKTWQNDTTYFIKTPISTNLEILIQFLLKKNIVPTYFRDISQSVKTKFYEDTL